MKNITTQFFVTFGVIFLILLTIVIYIFMNDSYGLRGSFAPTQSDNQPVSTMPTDTTEADASPQNVEASGGFQLSSGQIEALVSMGVDPATVPTSVSAEQEACFVEALGQDRVNEIKTGVVPNALEFLKAQSCI